jgi:hypothetical protein
MTPEREGAMMILLYQVRNYRGVWTVVGGLPSNQPLVINNKSDDLFKWSIYP